MNRYSAPSTEYKQSNRMFRMRQGDAERARDANQSERNVTVSVAVTVADLDQQKIAAIQYRVEKGRGVASPVRPIQTSQNRQK
jgi:hypothetical protein